MREFLIGIDGGGTSCRAAVADAEGRILGYGKSGAANIMTAPDTALANIEKAARAAFLNAGLSEDLVNSARAYLGLAGNNVEDTVAYISARLPFAESTIESDGFIALQGALGDGDGAVAILGTGSIFIARCDTSVHYIGGWGYHIGDLGSGARLGQMALVESLLAYDLISPPSPMTTALLGEFNNEPPKMVGFSQRAKPGDFGRYAPYVFDYASQGDQTANRILTLSAGWVDAALDRVSDLTNGGRLCLLGGLATLYPPYLAERHRERLVVPAADALTGAIALAKSTYGSSMERSR
ncbi:N-acetylglucosamine kinase [Rhizobium sp. KVB221]|uniref:N-acetylglucosamine kinase n=1 Tax=Rhizobium setariae TaxID=2801340 RepID=A0A936YQF2_9HYPH|nr:N-acetylglucosamine kinase [Rhizobium setariae]MBL0372319.1 N-acetylglucosamine kinase [Rhizobium setariae]